MTERVMNCPSLEDLSAFHDGELTASERSALERHLASCDACSAALERLRRSSGLLAALPREEASDELVRRVARAAQSQGQRQPGKWRLMALPIASAAAMLIISFALLHVVRRAQEQSPARLGTTAENTLRKLQAPTGLELPANEAPAAAGAASPADGPAAAARSVAKESVGMQERDADATSLRLDSERQLAEFEDSKKVEAGAARSEMSVATEDKRQVPTSQDELRLARVQAKDDRGEADARAPAEAITEQSVGGVEGGVVGGVVGSVVSGVSPSTPPAAPQPMAKPRASSGEYAAVPAEAAKASNSATDAAASGGKLARAAPSASAATMGADLAQAPADPSTPMNITAGVTPPELITGALPDWPSTGEHFQISAVILLCIIDTQGMPRVERVLRSAPRLDKPAIDAVTLWRYKPAIYQGHPQAVRLVVHVEFAPPAR